MITYGRSCLLILLQGLSGVVAAQSLTVNVEVFGLSENQFDVDSALRGACAAIDIDGPANDAATDLLSTCAALDPLDDEDPALAAGLDRLVPEEAFSLSDSLTDASSTQVSNVFSRIATIRRPRTSFAATGLAPTRLAPRRLRLSDDADGDAGGLRASRLEVFLSAQISDGTVNGADVQQDADLSSNSFTLGADYRVTNRLTLGIGTGYARDDTMFTDAIGGTEVETLSLTLFGTYHRESTFYLDVVLDVGSSSIDLERQLNLPGLAEVLALGRTDSSLYSLSAGIGRGFSAGAWDLVPRARLGLTRSTVDAYREDASATTPGFGSTLNVGSQEVRSGRLSAGAALSRSIGTTRGVVVPHLSVDLEFETEKEKDEIDASFVVDPARTRFSIDGTTRDQRYANLGLGVTAVFGEGRSAYALYESRLQHDFIARHWLKAGARLEF